MGYKVQDHRPASSENIIIQYHVLGSGKMKEDPYSHLTEERKKKEHKHSIRSFISVLFHSQKQSPHDQNTSIRPISQPSYSGDLVSDGFSSLRFIILSMKNSFGCASGSVSREL